MKRSLIGRLNLLIKRFTLVSLFFVLAVAFSFGFASYRVDMKNTADESRMLAVWLKDFRSLTFRETDVRGTAYALFDDGVLYVNSGDRAYAVYREDLPENVFIFSPDGETFDGRETVKEGFVKIRGYRGYAVRFPVGKSFWYVFVGRRLSSVLLFQLPFLVCLAFLSFAYAWAIRAFLVRTKDSLKKDLDALKSLVETFAEKGEVPVMSGSESWEIRSLAKMMFDLSQKIKDVQSQVLQKAGTDELTGLANRSAFEEKIENRILQDRMFSLIFMDLNGFKPINDTLGHDKGDEVLKEVAIKLRKVFRECDFIARWGGDEFAVLFEGDAEKLFDSVKGRILNALSEIDAEGMKVSAAVGYAVWPVDGRTSGELFRTADERMYADKILSKAR